jgi:hypothetical protein
MNDELHAATFVKKSFCDDDVLAGYDAQGSLTCIDIFDGLLGSPFIEGALAFKKRYAFRFGDEDVLTEPRYFARELKGAARCLTVPKGNRRRHSMRILHADAAVFDALDPP